MLSYQRKQQQGSILVLVLIVSAVLFLAVGMSFSNTQMQLRLADRSHDFKQALALAEAGIEQAVQALNTSSTNSSFTGSLANAGDFAVTITGSGPARVIEATGFVPSSAAPVVARRVRVLASLTESPSYFRWGIFSFTNIVADNSFEIGSWSSALPDSPPTSVNHLHSFGNIGAIGNGRFGDGRGNSVTVRGSVQLGGSIVSSIHNGKLGNNPDGLPNTIITNSPPQTPPDFPSDSMLAAQYNNNNATGITAITTSGESLSAYDAATGTLNVSQNNATVFFEPGVYYLNGINITGNSVGIVVQPEGKVTLYLDGDFILDGNGAYVNQNQPPGNFTVFQSSGRTFWNNAGRINLALYAPWSNIEISNASNVFGSIVANAVSIANGGLFAYDEQLGNTTDDGTGGVLVTSWMEITPPNI